MNPFKRFKIGMPTLGRFAASVLVATALGSIAQTQINLAALQALGAPIPMGVRLSTTAEDLIGFTPAYAGIVTAAFLFALPVASVLTRYLRQTWLRYWVFALAAALGLGIALEITDAIAPMPTLIAATRSAAGTVLMLLCASLGALVFALPQSSSYLKGSS